MNPDPQLSVQLPRCDEFQQPHTIPSDWLAASGATRPGTFRLINGLAFFQTTPTLAIYAFPAPVGRANDSVFHNHSPQVSEKNDSKTTDVVQSLPRYCALSYADNKPSTPASPNDNEHTKFGRWITLAGPAQSISINMQVLEDAARAAYEHTKTWWLWVDALCIMLDDEGDVRWHLENRSQIFSNADFCLVLLAGLGKHASIEKRTDYFSAYQTLLDVVCPKPEDVVVLHSWPNEYGSGQWCFPQRPDVTASRVYDSDIPQNQEENHPTRLARVRNCVAISFLATLLRVIVEGGTFKEAPTQRDPEALKAEKPSEKTTSDSGLLNMFGEVYSIPSQVGQVSDPAPLNPYSGVYGTLLLAMLAQPYQPLDLKPAQSIVNGVKEYAILLNAFQRALSSTSNVPTDTHNFTYWLCGALTAHKTAVNVCGATRSSIGDVPGHITFLKTLTRTYSPTSNRNTIFWIMVFALVEAWKHPDLQFINAYRSLLDGIGSDLPFYYAPLDVHLIRNPESISELRIEDDSTVILHLANAHAVEVSLKSKELPKSAGERAFSSTDGDIWQAVGPLRPKPASQYYMVYIGQLEGFVGSESDNRAVSREILDQNEKELARMPVGKHGRQRAMIIRKDKGVQNRFFPERWCRLHDRDMSFFHIDRQLFSNNRVVQKRSFDLRLSY
ncbi:uncharacterized protein TRAVEDRAFT_24536 [Trametes versicolor FP-101664 SS1]|uniref:uncharacterized protein n=1 Tax=Trametes versicolor (strain FP-101664) TaxID=717944 RepID=UPI00046219C3|nr:uncharacterized protein TRAVEDRAFT_24536 [Trametes versicolor FP-101664 SS1]EIW52303.1 hypothetical protein TRAVEDRAFT_24536 [Trametes versicolor FP-101664 SS1]